MNSLDTTVEKFKKLSIKLQIIVLTAPIFLLITMFLAVFIREQYIHFKDALIFYIKPAVLGIGLVTVVTPVFIYIGRKLNIVDRSGNNKDNPVPLLGGLVIYASFFGVALMFGPWTRELIGIFIGSTIILVLGTIDDISPLSSKVRLIGQLLASVIVMCSGLLISFPPITFLGNLMAVILTVFWILGIMNATNFLDGADGLAVGLMCIASGFFFLISLHLQQETLSLITIIMVGCCIGFLFHNFKPAKIYLGDGGSTTLGFLLACFALYGGWSDRGFVVALGIPILILGVLIFDMIYITISRIRNNKIKNIKDWLDYRGRDHFHHRLMKLGFREEQAVIFIYIISVILGISALTLENAKTDYPVIIMLFQAFLIFTNISILMLMGREVTDGSS